MQILVLEHEPETPPGLFDAWASARDYELDVAAVPQLERWPDPGEYDALVSLGSDSSVHASPYPWIPRELDFLAAAHAEQVPVLGICFGGQALAKALGGKVRRAPRADVGWRGISSDSSQLITPGPWFRWHSDRFTLPPGARLLAGSDAEPDAFTLKRSVGLQFHPEVDAALAEQWIAGGRAKLTEHGIDTRELHEEVARQAPGARERAFDLFDRIAEWWALSKPHALALRRTPTAAEGEDHGERRAAEPGRDQRRSRGEHDPGRESRDR
jgi:GMP synthase-like glutamine amidotransferase